jgi:Glycosyltransferase family 87
VRPAAPGQDAGLLVALGYVAFSLFGLAVVLVSAEPLHRLWGGCAAVGYCCAALAVLAPARLALGRWRRDIAIAAAVSGALVVPLCWLAAAGRGMPEVGVVAHSAELLVAHGRPYQPAAQLGSDVYGYNPYLPGMTVFGLPRAIFGGGLLTDPRVWDAIAFLTAFAAALRIAGVTCGPALRRTVALAGTPLIAFPLAVSGNDLPVIGLICLGLALAGQADPRSPAGQAGPALSTGHRARAGRITPTDPVWAGVALGAACTLKATAWPALLVVGVLLAARDGRAAAARCAAAAAAALAVAVGPFLLIQPADLAVNTIAFPLGLTAAHSPAASPLPGHLIAATGHAGRLTVITLLIVTMAVLGARLASRPPRTAASAASYLALTLTALFTLAPSTRWGYFVYPAVIGCWLWLAGRGPDRIPGRSWRPVTVPGYPNEPE